MSDVKDIRITDSFLRRQVAAEQKKRGDSTPTKTASKLISERLAQLELTRRETAKEASAK